MGLSDEVHRAVSAIVNGVGGRGWWGGGGWKECRKTYPNSTTTVTLFNNQPQVHSMDRTGTCCTNIYIFDQYLSSTSEQQVWTMYDTHFPHPSSYSVA